MKKELFIFVVALGCICYADVKLKPLSESDGQIIVQREYLRCKFAKGAFGNEVSLLLPFCWMVNGDTLYTYFSAAEQKYLDGVSWEIRQVLDGKMIPVENEWTPETDVWFQPFQLFEVKCNDGSRRIFYYHDNYSYASQKDMGEKITLVNTTWYELSVETNGTPKKVVMKDGLQSILKNESTSVMCNVIPHKYQGADAKVIYKQSNSREHPVTYPHQSWSLTEAQKEQIAMLHRDYVERNHPNVAVSNVYIVVGDGNFDGVCDAYVSTDAEKKDGENYVWSLYVAKGAQFFRADMSVAQTFGKVETVYVDCEVCVAKDSFFRLDRKGVPSYIMPIRIDKGKMEVWDYITHESCVQAFRRRAGLSNATFSDCIRTSGSGVASLGDLFSGFAPLICIRRIPCETFVVANERIWRGEVKRNDERQ